MALLNTKLYVKSDDGAATPCNLYSTQTEVGGDYVTVIANNIKAYAKLGGGHLTLLIPKAGLRKAQILMRF